MTSELRKMYLNMHRDIVAKNLGLGLRERARHDTIFPRASCRDASSKLIYGCARNPLSSKG